MEITEEQRAAIVKATIFARGAKACINQERKDVMFDWALEELDKVGGEIKARFMLFLLVDPDHGCMRFATDVERPDIQLVVDLWTREAEGERVDPDVWAAARAAAWDDAWAAAGDVQINQLLNELRPYS